MKEVKGLQVRELRREVRELERLVDRLKAFDSAKRAQEPILPGEVMRNPLMINSQNPHYTREVSQLEKQQANTLSSNLSDDSIRHLQEENRKYLSRKVEAARNKMLENEERLFVRHQALSKTQDEVLALKKKGKP